MSRLLVSRRLYAAVAHGRDAHVSARSGSAGSSREESRDECVTQVGFSAMPAVPECAVAGPRQQADLAGAVQGAGADPRHGGKKHLVDF